MLAAGHFLGAAGVHCHRMRNHLLRIGRHIQRQINHRVVHVQVNLGIRAVEFQGRLPAGQRVPGADSVLSLHLCCVQFLGQQLHQFRRTLKRVQRKHAVLIGQLQAVCDFGHAGLHLVALCSFLLVDCRRLFHSRRRILHGCRRVIALPLARRLPVHQVLRQLFPIAATLHGDIPHPVAHNLVLPDQLIGSVLEDEPVVCRHARLVGLQRQRLLRRRGNRGRQQNRQRAAQ